jgi:hypothetical protein
MVVWLFGILMGCLTVQAVVAVVVRGWAAVGVARAQADSVRAAAEAQVSAAVFPPTSWSGERDGL